uniref:JmjC domain-containing protein n=1 Tax=Thaumasiovibrio occultus TaxID=1891184 RepID=UPI000B34ED5A|nr:cupin domain-containing protein [Thaumasiovibrio occultus]
MKLHWDFTAFINDHWQQAPLYIEKALPELSDLISPAQVHALATDPEITTYMDIGDGPYPIMRYGPFDNQESASKNATLRLVAAHHWLPELSALLKPFSHLPSWLIETLTVSIHQPQKWCGPFIDNFDTLLLQGSGKRRWQLGEKVDDVVDDHSLPEYVPTETLGRPSVDVEMCAGDLLYIPAGVPYRSLTIDEGITYALLLRTPSPQELVQNLSDFLQEEDASPIPMALTPREENGEISTKDFAAMEDAIRDWLDQPERMKTWIGALLSRSRHELDIVASPAPWLENELYDYLQKGNRLIKLPGLKTLYHPDTPETLYIDGEVFTVPSNNDAIGPLICNHSHLDITHFGENINDPVTLALVCELTNLGYFRPESE